MRACRNDDEFERRGDIYMTAPVGAATSTNSVFDPTGKTFSQRLDAFIADVQAKYSLAIRKDSGRTAEWEQKLHIAHMFLYNKYQSTVPANVEPGKRTISWSHLSDATVVWATVQWSDFLRTSKDTVPLKFGNAWKQGGEPDKAATESRAKALLSDAGIGDNGKAMVAAGTKPCGEPCRCGAGRSKHLDNLAADLNSGDLDMLTGKMTAAKAGDIDSYLKSFGLNRPLVNHPTSPEKWHVEAIP
jgi:hypothetical protein